MPHPQRGPPERVLVKLTPKLCGESASVSSPEKVEIRLANSCPPQPQSFQLATPPALGKSSLFDQIDPACSKSRCRNGRGPQHTQEPGEEHSRTGVFRT